MTKAELIERISRSRELPSDLTKKVVAQVVDLAFEELAEYFAKTRITRSSTPRFSFPGFGTFTKKKRRARMGVNPRTLEPMEIEESCTIDFRPAASLRATMTGAVKTSKAKHSKTSARRSAGVAELAPEMGARIGTDATTNASTEQSAPRALRQATTGRSAAASRLAALLEADAFSDDQFDPAALGDGAARSRRTSSDRSSSADSADGEFRHARSGSGERREANPATQARSSTALPELGLRRTGVPSRTNRRSGHG